MKLSKFLLFMLVLPITLGLDLVLYGILNTCPGCNTFSNFLKTEGAMSFPFITELVPYLHHHIKNSRVGKKIIS